MFFNVRSRTEMLQAEDIYKVRIRVFNYSGAISLAQLSSRYNLV